MQKKLIALAIAGLSSTAFAQSNVTISGQLKAGFERYEISGPNLNGTNGKQNMISDQTSSIVLKGEEGLGNGLSAIFQIDNRFTVDTGNTSTSTGLTTTGGAGTTGTLGSGNTWIGLKSASLGEFKMGRQDLHYNESERIEYGAKSLSQQALVSRAILSQVDGNNIGPNATRTNNVLFWDSPNWAGITARIAHSTSVYGQEGATNAQSGSAQNYVLRYENAGLKLGGSLWRQRAEDGGAGGYTNDANQKGNRFWAGYTIAGFSFGLIYDRSSTNPGSGDAAGEKRRNGWAIPLAYTFGNHAVFGTYGQVRDYKSGNGQGNDSGAKQYMLGYEYNMSKRTSIGVNYAVLKNDRDGLPAATAEGDYTFANLGGKGVTPSNGDKASQFYVGLRHAY